MRNLYTLRWWLTVTLLLAVSVWPVDALVSRWIADLFPAERLVENLKNEIKKRPTNGELYARLGRAYSIWYVHGGYMKDVKLWVARDDPYTADQVILRAFNEGAKFREKNKSTPLQEQALRKNLERLTNSITSYEKAIQLGHTNVFVYLGLGWTQHQAGKTNEAKQNYRIALKLSGTYRQKFDQLTDLEVTSEIAEYLLSLLHPVNDKEEYDRVRQMKIAGIKRIPQRITPIIVPTSAETIPLRDIIDWNGRVSFDLDGSGSKQGQWITTNAAWLVYQKHPDEPIVSGIQMFGSVTFWMFWRNGYAALKSLDDDGDGYLDGKELRQLGVWEDRNCDGKSEAPEIQSLHAYGIVRLSTEHRALGTGDYMSREGAVFRDGTIRPTYDISLRSVEE